MCRSREDMHAAVCIGLGRACVDLGRACSHVYMYM